MKGTQVKIDQRKKNKQDNVKQTHYIWNIKAFPEKIFFFLP